MARPSSTRAKSETHAESATKTDSPVDDYREVDSKWTVMVFMGADTVQGDFPLAEPAKADILEMGVVGSGGPLNIFVQVHGLDQAPRRAKIQEGMTWETIQRDDTTIVPPEYRDTKGGLALADFIRNSLVDSGHDPRNPFHYCMLVLWGHAYDFGVARAPNASGTPDALDYVEVGRVLDRMQAAVQQQLDLPDRPKLDVIAFDACDVATVELAYELAPYAHYLLGSQVGVPIPGWPYDRVLKQLRLPLGRVMSPPEFGLWSVRRFIEAYAPLRSVSLSMLNLRLVTPLVARAKVLTDLIESAIEQSPDMHDLISDIFDRSLTAVDRPYIDVADFCLNLARETGDAGITAAARMLGDFLIAAQFPVVNRSTEFTSYPFVVANGRNAGDTAKLNGVSLYAPHSTADEQFRNTRPLYDTMRFARVTRWSELVHGLAEQE